MEYNAASDAYTNATQDFKEFYNQRRRWGPSTMANTRAGLVIGHTGHFPRGPTHFRGRQNVFFLLLLIYAKDHHAGTASSQWPIGLCPMGLTLCQLK